MGRQQHKLFREFQKYLTAHQLISPGQKILLALSGGCDSVVLLDLLVALQDTFPYTVIACHLDHGLRGEISAAESWFVQSLCREYAVDCRCGFSDIPALSAGRNVEEVAREVRYDFLRRTAVIVGADCIATAHHADDQAETVLLHLLHGSGPQGLAAIHPCDRQLIRPLLFATKADIMAYSREYQLPFCEDASNHDQKYLRNKIRWSLLPYLEQEYNPQIRANLVATAEIIRAENNFMAETATDYYHKLQAADGSLAMSELLSLPLALARRLVRRAYQEHSGRELSFRNTEAVLALAESSALDLPGLTVYRRSGRLYFGPLPPKSVISEWQEPVTMGGWYPLPEGWQYLAESLPPDQPPREYPKGCDRIIISWPCQAYFTGRRAGTKMAVWGMQGHKSLKSIYQEAQVPLEQRANRPILYLHGEPVWLPFLKRAVADCQEGWRLAIYCRQIENIS